MTTPTTMTTDDIVTTVTMRNGFSSKDEFKNSLETIVLYNSSTPDFFKYSYAIYNSLINSEYKDNADVKKYLRTIYLGVDCIRDEGWNFPKWQVNERRDMIPALLALYDSVQGFDWSKMNEISSFND